LVKSRRDWSDTVTKLMQPQPGRFMTEAEPENCVSVCSILGALCCLPEHVVAAGLFDAGNRRILGEAALALMGECVSRCARVQVKAEVAKMKMRCGASEVVTDAQASHKLTCRALNIKAETCDVPSAADLISGGHDRPSGDYDRASARVKSGNFFARSWTNASPQAVVACFAFAEMLAQSPHAVSLDSHLAVTPFGPPEQVMLYRDVSAAFEAVKST